MSPARGAHDDQKRVLVMGVLNVTPDSFSDGGRWLDPVRALEHAGEMATAGADLIDVGGESTRPGAVQVTPAEELARVLPVVTELVNRGLRVSIDTRHASVAHAALAAGAVLVNDVSAGAADPDMLPVVAAAGTDVVLMHSRGPAATRPAYDDVVADVTAELLARRDAALSAGVAAERIVLDPGIGFAKGPRESWALLAALPQLVALGHRVLVGASRKSFLGALLERPDPADREAATQAITALAARDGAWCVRVHEVRPAADAVRVVEALRRAAGRSIDE
jgi:dihydropteroate synthase